MAEHTMKERLAELERRQHEARHAGSDRSVERQRDKGKMLARERIEYLLDPGSFHELDMLARHRAHEAGLDSRPYTDGVITGWGTIDGRKVFVFSQDFTVMGGALGEVFAEKIHKVMDLALSTGSPMIGLNDGAGARIQEGVVSLDSYGGIFHRNVQLSGVIPQISVILGPCAGGAVYSPAMTDFIFMVREKSHMFITGPDVVKTVTGEEVTLEELGGATATPQVRGRHLRGDYRGGGARRGQVLLSHPARQQHGRAAVVRSQRRPRAALSRLSRHHARQPEPALRHEGCHWRDRRRWRVHGVPRLVGSKHCLRVCPPRRPRRRRRWQSAAHAGGRPRYRVLIQGRPLCSHLRRLQHPAVHPRRRPGVPPGVDQEYGGIIRHGAKLLYAYCEATVPRIQVITRKAYGGAYVVMDSKSVGCDVSFAWPTAEIAVMGPQGAVEVLHRREFQAAADPDALKAELVEEYTERFANPYIAAERGFVDDVIDPAETRRKVIAGFAAIRGKREDLPARKHGIIPL